MKMIRNTAFFIGMIAIPAMALAQTAPATKAPATTPAPAKSAAKATPAAKETVHATKGVVKSLDATTLVVTPAKGKDLTFVLNSTTVKTGTPAVGSSVQVHYKTDGSQNIATAVSVQAAQTKKK
jgi:hypothetical protein